MQLRLRRFDFAVLVGISFKRFKKTFPPNHDCHDEFAANCSKSTTQNSNPIHGTEIRTLLGTNISPPKVCLKMIFLLPRWDMLVRWRVILDDFWKNLLQPCSGSFFSVSLQLFSPPEKRNKQSKSVQSVKLGWLPREVVPHKGDLFFFVVASFHDQLTKGTRWARPYDRYKWTYNPYK